MGSSEVAESPPPDRRGERARGIVRGIGELLITLGLVLLLFVFYEVYVTDWFSARQQQAAGQRLRQHWQQRPPGQPAAPPVDGDGFAELYIPKLGHDYRYTVLEGTDPRTLSHGPGHYAGTAMPGEQGNLAIAGHRIGRGAPFGDIDRLAACDALVVETATEWYVYRVLPMRDQLAGWNPGADPRCTGVAPIGGPYTGLAGQEIVRPEQGEVIYPVPGKPPTTLPREQQTRLITLTTCHPWYSAQQRLIVHGVLVKRYPKEPAHPELRPPELEET